MYCKSFNVAAGVSGELSGVALDCATLAATTAFDCACFVESALALVNKTALTAATVTKLAANLKVVFMLGLLVCLCDLQRFAAHSPAPNNDLIIYPYASGRCEPFHKFAVCLSTIVRR